jgi:hypothetical protein
MIFNVIRAGNDLSPDYFLPFKISKPMLLNENPENWFWLLISVLTVWRLTTLLCYQAGPFNLMSKIRLLLYRLKLGSLIECFHCTAMWFALITTLAVYKISGASFFLVFAIAGGASIIEKIIYHEPSQEQETGNE